MVKNGDKAEFLGKIIDIFEDFLDSKNVSIDNSERFEYADGDEEGLAIIFGTDYDLLETELEAMMENWGIFDEAGDFKTLESHTNWSSPGKTGLDE